MQCPSCGAENSGSATFCSLCLSPLVGESAPADTGAETTATESASGESAVGGMQPAAEPAAPAPAAPAPAAPAPASTAPAPAPAAPAPAASPDDAVAAAVVMPAVGAPPPPHRSGIDAVMEASPDAPEPEPVRDPSLAPVAPADELPGPVVYGTPENPIQGRAMLEDHAGEQLFKSGGTMRSARMSAGMVRVVIAVVVLLSGSCVWFLGGGFASMQEGKTANVPVPLGSELVEVDRRITEGVNGALSEERQAAFATHVYSVPYDVDTVASYYNEQAGKTGLEEGDWSGSAVYKEGDSYFGPDGGLRLIIEGVTVGYYQGHWTRRKDMDPRTEEIQDLFIEILPAEGGCTVEITCLGYNLEEVVCEVR